MLLKTINSKFIINLKYILALVITLLALHVISAQEIIEDEVKDTIKAHRFSKNSRTFRYKDSVNNFKPVKVDGVAAVVGDFIILDSDIDKA